jgi:hypothetical protein
MNAYGIDLTPYVIFGSILFLLLLFLLLRKIKGSVENQKHWQHSFDGLEYSSAEFFDLVESAISSRNMPDIEFSRAVYSQDGILSDNREYLHIEIGPFVYDVGAAPFGNCFFVSLWFAERHGLWHKFKRSIPIFKESAERKSYYKMILME